MAKMELFIIVSNLLQKYRFEAAGDVSTLPGVDDSRLGVNLIPPRYKLVAHKL